MKCSIVGNGSGLGEVCEALACAVGQIAPNLCYVVVFFFIFLCGGCILFYLIFNELETILKIN